MACRSFVVGPCSRSFATEPMDASRAAISSRVARYSMPARSVSISARIVSTAGEKSRSGCSRRVASRDMSARRPDRVSDTGASALSASATGNSMRGGADCSEATRRSTVSRRSFRDDRAWVRMAGNALLLVRGRAGGIVEAGFGLLDPACHGFQRNGRSRGLILGLPLAFGRDGRHEGVVILLRLRTRRGGHPGDQAVEIAAGRSARLGTVGWNVLVVLFGQNGRSPFLKAQARPACRGHGQLAGVEVVGS